MRIESGVRRRRDLRLKAATSKKCACGPREKIKNLPHAFFGNEREQASSRQKPIDQLQRKKEWNGLLVTQEKRHKRKPRGGNKRKNAAVACERKRRSKERGLNSLIVKSVADRVQHVKKKPKKG